ncbi:MAG: hypothetical protein PHT16_00310 [Candidatus Pacebacteria bacterium]|nr:hypothetical protein [Candidatus Paceibacterota bacterium]
MRRLRKNTKRNSQSGAAMLISVIFFLFISLAIIAGLVGPTVQEFKISSDLVKSKQSLFLSESGIEDAYFRLKNSTTINSPISINLGGNTSVTTITDSGYNEKTIISLGDVSSRQRNSEMVLLAGDGVSFSYGIQSGVGGFVIGNAIVHGNVYSNGNITGANGARITGSAFAAGASGVIDNIDVGENGEGDARAHTVNNSTVLGNLYCQSGSHNNKSCNISEPDPVAVDMPITEVMISKWKQDAEAENNIIIGDLTITSSQNLGPVKITGNLAINADITVTGTIYVMGNITTNNGAHITLSSSYGSTGGIIVTDGRVTLSNNVKFFGSGGPNTYVLLVTTSACPLGCSGLNAIEILNNVGAILVNAQNGTVHLNNGVELNEVVGKTIDIDNSAEIWYLSGLANQNFTSGPTGGWDIKNWKEVQ